MARQSAGAPRVASRHGRCVALTGGARGTLVLGSLLASGEVQAQREVAVPVAPAVASAKTVPMRDVTMSGVLNPERRELSAVVVAAIGTPLGRIPIRGNIRVQLECRGAFHGTISYHPVVRFFARVKGVDLITALDGAIVDPTDDGCVALALDTLRGTATVERTELQGTLVLRGDSIRFIGPAWMVGDSSYHSLLRVTRADRSLDVRINLFERAGAHRPPHD